VKKKRGQRIGKWRGDMGVGTGGAEGAAAPPNFGTGEQAIALDGVDEDGEFQHTLVYLVQLDGLTLTYVCYLALCCHPLVHIVHSSTVTRPTVWYATALDLHSCHDTLH